MIISQHNSNDDDYYYCGSLSIASILARSIALRACPCAVFGALCVIDALAVYIRRHKVLFYWENIIKSDINIPFAVAEFLLGSSCTPNKCRMCHFGVVLCGFTFHGMLTGAPEYSWSSFRWIHFRWSISRARSRTPNRPSTSPRPHLCVPYAPQDHEFKKSTKQSMHMIALEMAVLAMNTETPVCEGNTYKTHFTVRKKSFF